jgi:aminoglycoside phosphotransferase (APT) family kinase protein
MAVIDISTLIEYVQGADLSRVPGWKSGDPFEITALAQGEYNLNYRLRQGPRQWVLRVNLGTQINRDDQILYEYRALQLLSDTGVTPLPYFVDDSRERLPQGVLLMEYLPGEALDYRSDLEVGARALARIHSRSVEKTENHLIVEERPLSMTYQECSRLLAVYFESEQADPEVSLYMKEVLSWAEEACRREAYFLGDPWRCIINTEVNSGNFILDRTRGSAHLVDWEKPLWGDPSQDLSHFCVPTTTLWKTDCRLEAGQRQRFLEAYRANVSDAHLRDTIEERVRLRDPFNCLRGISWSAMAWVAYLDGRHALRNEDTFRKIEQYLQPGFLHSLFEPYLF